MSSTRGLLVGLVVASVVASGIEAAQAVEYACPAALTAETKLTGVPQGWQPFATTTRLTARRVGIFLADPGSGSAQVPDTTQRKGREQVDVWSLPRAAGDEYWLGCFYDETSAVTATRLAPSAKQCSVRYSLTKAGTRSAITSIRCD